MKIDQVDLMTRVASQVLDILLMKYPTRTGLGLVLGSIFSFAVQLFAPALRSIKYMDFASSPGGAGCRLVFWSCTSRPQFPLFGRNPSAMTQLIKQWS